MPYDRNKALRGFFLFHGCLNFEFLFKFARYIQYSSPSKRLEIITGLRDYLLLLVLIFSGSDEEALSRHIWWET